MCLRLSNDCMLSVCEFLSEDDRISLWYVSRRMASIVETFYQYRTHEALFQYWGIPRNITKRITKTQRNLSISLETINLCENKANRYERLCALSFPNVRKLTVGTSIASWNISSCLVKDFKLFGFQFPQLTKLTLRRVPSARTIWTMTDLRELVLEDCFELDPKHVRQILFNLPLIKLTIIQKMLKNHGRSPHLYCYKKTRHLFKTISECQTLEELVVDYHYYRMFESELPKLKKLRLLNIGPRDEATCKCNLSPMSPRIASYLASKTKILTIKSLHPSPCKLESRFTSVDYDEDFVFHFLTPDDDENEVIDPKKKTLHIELFRYIESKYRLRVKKLDVFGNCVAKANMDFSRNVFVHDAKNHALRCIYWFGQNRETPLMIRCAAINFDDIKGYILPKCIKFSTKLVNYKATGPGIQCEW